jgi:hypothetical protein
MQIGGSIPIRVILSVFRDTDIGIGTPNGPQFTNAANLSGLEGVKIVFFVKPKKPT